jgi:hypothetical protein
VAPKDATAARCRCAAHNAIEIAQNQLKVEPRHALQLPLQPTEKLRPPIARA